MSDGSRRQRATLWAWAYLALFGSERETGEAPGESPGNDGNSAGDPSGERGTG